MPRPKLRYPHVEEISVTPLTQEQLDAYKISEGQTSQEAPDSAGTEVGVDTEAIHPAGVVSSGRTSNNDASLDASAD